MNQFYWSLLALSGNSSLIEVSVWTQVLTALLIGVLTAFGFQFLLSILGLAIGISTLQTPSFSLLPFFGQSQRRDPETTEDSKSETSSLGLIAGLGILFTINLVLFGAGLLATTFSRIHEPVLGAIAGLVIWSAYILLLVWISSIAVGSLVEALLNLVTVGVRQIVSTMRAVFNQRKEEAITQDQLVKIIHQEIQESLITTNLQSMLEQAIEDQLKSEITNHLGEPRTTQAVDSSEVTLEDSLVWQAVEQYLLETDAKKLTTKRIERKIHKMVQPHLQNEERLPEINQPDVTTLLDQRADLSSKQKSRIASQIESLWQQLLIQESSRVDPPEADAESVETTSPLSHLAEGLSEVDFKALSKPIAAQLFNLVQQNWVILAPLFLEIMPTKVKDAVNTLDVPALDSQTAKQQIQQWITSTPELLTDANQSLVSTVEDWRDRMANQMEQTYGAVQDRVNAVNQHAQQQLDETRKAAARAAWWLFLITLTSAGSASLAGAIAAGF